MRVLALAIAMIIGGAAPGPTPVSAASPTGVEVIRSSTYTDAGGDTHVGGLVQNFTPWPVKFVKITVRYYDSGGTLLADDWSYSLFDTVNPWFRYASPFEIITTLPQLPARYELSVTWRSTVDPANTNFTLYNDFPGGQLSQHVRNLNTTVAQYVKVAEYCEASADPSQGFINWTYVDSNTTSDIQPGQSATYRFYPSRELTNPMCFVHAQSSTPPALPTTLTTTPHETVYGRPVTFRGAAKPGDDVSITLWLPGGTTREGARTTADVDGAYSVSVPLQFSGMVEATAANAQSVPTSVLSDAAVTLRSSATTVRKGAQVTVSGTVRPLYPGKRVVIQRYLYGTWRNFKTLTLNSASAFSYRWVPTGAATYMFRAFIDTQVDTFAGTSPTRKVVVR